MGDAKQFCVECEVTFLLGNEGGPSSERYWPKDFKGYRYRPCFVFGDPNQRRAKIVSKDIEVEAIDGSKKTIRTNNFVDEPYFGVGFKDGPENPELGKPFTAIAVPISQSQPDIVNFQKDATFTIREGAKIVGYGSILRNYYSAT